MILEMLTDGPNLAQTPRDLGTWRLPGDYNALTDARPAPIGP